MFMTYYGTYSNNVQALTCFTNSVSCFLPDFHFWINFSSISGTCKFDDAGVVHIVVNFLGNAAVSIGVIYPIGVGANVDGVGGEPVGSRRINRCVNG